MIEDRRILRRDADGDYGRIRMEDNDGKVSPAVSVTNQQNVSMKIKTDRGTHDMTCRQSNQIVEGS